jgi:hypothetical protein
VPIIASVIIYAGLAGKKNGVVKNHARLKHQNVCCAILKDM